MRCHRAVVSPCLSGGYAKNNDDDDRMNGARKFRQTKDNGGSSRDRRDAIEGKKGNEGYG